MIQAADERIAYFFDHRWLYQDLSDFPRPQLLDVAFADPAEREQVFRKAGLLGAQLLRAEDDVLPLPTRSGSGV